MLWKSFFMAAVLPVAVVGVAEARDRIKIVGSSTVFPFTTAVAEQFGKTTKFKTPLRIHRHGGGMKLFCGGFVRVIRISPTRPAPSKSPKLKSAPRTASTKSPKSRLATTVSLSPTPSPLRGRPSPRNNCFWPLPSRCRICRRRKVDTESI